MPEAVSARDCCDVAGFVDEKGLFCSSWRSKNRPPRHFRSIRGDSKVNFSVLNSRILVVLKSDEACPADVLILAGSLKKKEFDYFILSNLK